jgi:hypothetical protein
MDTGPEQISDASERQQVQRQARQVYIKAIISAAILTGLALVQ